MTFASTASTPDWFAGFGSLETEIADARALDVHGTLPADLDGTLYRIGPARHDVYGERYRHWFDGDGMVHALDLRAGAVTYRNRFVATAAKRDEDTARKRIFGGFGTRAAGGPIARFRHRAPANKANTNVVLHAGRLMALWEGGRPYRLDPTTLETLGEDDLGGVLRPDDNFSAHPKFDPATGEMWNFGLGQGRVPTLHVYATAADGTTRRAAAVPLPFSAWLHDVALTKRYVVAVLGPLVLPRVPLGLLIGQRSYAESLRWKPELGTRIALIDRVTGDARWLTAGPMMVVHVAHAFDDGDAVVVDLALYDDAALLQAGWEFMDGLMKTELRAWATRLTVHTATGRVERRRLADDGAMEFPRVAGRALAGEHTRIHGVGWHEARGREAFIGVPLTVDLARGGRVTRAAFAPHEYAGECVPVSKRGARDDADVWLLTLVLDAARGTTELRVLDGADVSAPAVASVPLPHRVPFGFHGNFVHRARVSAAA